MKSFRLSRLPPAGKAGASILLFFILTGILAPVISPYDPSAFSGPPLLAPCSDHWLGTNDLGQDIFSELLRGARLSIFIGLTVGSSSSILATFVALAAGGYGGWTDRLLMRVVDIFLAFPRLPAIILLAAFMGSSVIQIVVVLFFFSWAKGARVIRSQVTALMKSPHIEACRLFGATRRYVLTRHVLPEILPLSAFKFIKSASYALMAESGLAFLGIGDPTAKSWGMMLHYVRNYPGIYYTKVWLWWFCPPAFCLMLSIIGFVLIGYAAEAYAHPRILKNIR